MYADEDENEFRITPFQCEDQGTVIEVLMHDTSKDKESSAIFLVHKAYGRQIGCPGQYILAYGLAHEDDAMQKLHKKVSRATDTTLGKTVLLHTRRIWSQGELPARRPDRAAVKGARLNGGSRTRAS